jgi:hypothetical protein
VWRVHHAHAHGQLDLVRSSGEVCLGADSCSDGGSMRRVVLLGLAQELEQRRAAGRPGARIEGCARRRTRSGHAREVPEPRVRFACADLAEVDEKDRLSLVQLAHGAVDGVAVQCGPAQEPPGTAKAADPPAFGVALVGDSSCQVVSTGPTVECPRGQRRARKGGAGMGREPWDGRFAEDEHRPRFACRTGILRGL